MAGFYNRLAILASAIGLASFGARESNAAQKIPQSSNDKIDIPFEVIESDTQFSEDIIEQPAPRNDNLSQINYINNVLLYSLKNKNIVSNKGLFCNDLANYLQSEKINIKLYPEAAAKVIENITASQKWYAENSKLPIKDFKTAFEASRLAIISNETGRG